MADAVASTRKTISKLACKAEKLIHEVWKCEARMTAEAEGGTNPEAEELASDLACACVDHLHPAVESMREAGRPRRRTVKPAEFEEK